MSFAQRKSLSLVGLPCPIVLWFTSVHVQVLWWCVEYGRDSTVLTAPFVLGYMCTPYHTMTYHSIANYMTVICIIYAW